MSRTVDLTDYTEEELVELNRRIIERLRSLHQQRRYKEMARFNLGDTVSFTAEAGRTVVGKVIRANAKTITVLSSTGEHWRVSPGLLAHTTEGQQPAPPRASSSTCAGIAPGGESQSSTSGEQPDEQSVLRRWSIAAGRSRRGGTTFHFVNVGIESAKCTNE